MTSPPRQVEVVCPGCGVEYVAWHRPSINLTLDEEWPSQEAQAAISARCPKCRLVVELPALFIEEDKP